MTLNCFTCWASLRVVFFSLVKWKNAALYIVIWRRLKWTMKITIQCKRWEAEIGDEILHERAPLDHNFQIVPLWIKKALSISTTYKSTMRCYWGNLNFCVGFTHSMMVLVSIWGNCPIERCGMSASTCFTIN